MRKSHKNPPEKTMPEKNKHISYELRRRLVKGLRTAASSRTACEKSATGNTNVNILQLNILGLQNKRTELEHMLQKHDIHVAILQETILPNKKVNITGYTQYKCNCTKCQGVMTLIRNDTQAEVKNNNNDTDIDTQDIILWRGGMKYTLRNIYCPPSSTAKIDIQLPHHTRTIIAGDFNAHTPALGYPSYNNRGKELEDIVNSTNLQLIQSKNTPPTFLHRAHNTTSRPDVTLLSTDIIDQHTYTVLDDIGSDHRPILINIGRSDRRKTQRKSFWNYKKANWTLYAQETDAELSSFLEQPFNTTMYSRFVDIILRAAKRHIPCGHTKKYTPFWTPELESLVKNRAKARKTAEKYPTKENKTSYNKLTAKIRYYIKANKKAKWIKTCENMDLRKDGRRAWKLLHQLAGNKTKTNPRPMSQGKTLVTNSKKKANIFNKHFASTNKSQPRKHLDKAFQKILKKQEKSPTANINIFDTPFTEQELNEALKKLKIRKSPGPDKITNEMLQGLGHTAKEVLLKYINTTWMTGLLPKEWKTAKIIPILKKDKPPSDPKSYRPISLTSTIGKLAEKMVNARLYWWLEDTKSLHNTQAGFRKASRTEDHLYRFIQETVEGFQNNKHTTAVFIDLQQAYDRVWRTGLFLKMRKMGIHGKMHQWIRAFLQNRTIQTCFEGSISDKKTLEEGLPQGSALSCTLFLIFINDLPELIQVNKAVYADDLLIWTTEKYPVLARAKLNKALLTISIYTKLWKMNINKEKTVYTIFSHSKKTATRVYNLKLDSVLLKKEENPTYLGVRLDQKLSLKNFIADLKEKASKRLNIIKHLSSTSWGAEKNTLRQLYIGYIRSVLEYCLPLQTTANKTQLNTLDAIQNQALRLISGGMRSTPTAACEIDSNIEPLQLRRNRAALEAVERYRRLENDHPNKILTERNRTTSKKKQKTLLQISDDLQQKHHLPQNREPMTRHSPLPPGGRKRQPIIRTSLNNTNLSKSSNPLELKVGTLETIESYTDTATHIYTDGSAFKATINAGLGAYLIFPDKTSLEISAPCGNYCTNFQAEIDAMNIALETVEHKYNNKQLSPTDIAVFTDSQSALQAMANNNSPYVKETTLLEHTVDFLMNTYNITITFQWIPGHVGISGNENADRLARKGASMDQHERPVTYKTVCSMLKSNYKEEWLNQWAQGTTGRKMYKEMNQPNKGDNIKFLPRKEQCTIFQLRTGHVTLNSHLNRINPTYPPNCRHCHHPQETVEHFLFECPILTLLRNTLLPPQPTITNTLYSNKEQLKRTFQYFCLALTAREQLALQNG